LWKQQIMEGQWALRILNAPSKSQLGVDVLIYG